MTPINNIATETPKLHQSTHDGSALLGKGGQEDGQDQSTFQNLLKGSQNRLMAETRDPRSRTEPAALGSDNEKTGDSQEEKRPSVPIIVEHAETSFGEPSGKEPSLIASLSKDSWPKSHAIKVEHETVVSAGDTPEEPRKEIEPIMFQTPRPQALYASSKLGDEAPAQISGHAAGNSWGNSHQDQELFTRLNGSTEPKPLADVMTLTEPAAPTQRSGTEPAATSAAALNPVGKTLAELLTQQGTHPTATIASAVKTNQITRPDGSVVKTLRLQLNPAEMGMLNVSLKLIGDQMQVEVRAEKAIAHQSILQDQEALVAALRSAGIRLDTIVVSGPQAAAAPERLPGSDSGSSAGAGLAQSGAGNPDHKQRQLQHNGGFDFNYGDQSDKAVEPQPSTVRSHGLAVI